jgi:hypothetical protein
MDDQTGRARNGYWIAALVLVASAARAEALEVGPPLNLGVDIDGGVSVVRPLPSGRMVIGGAFERVRGLGSEGIALLEPDGTGVPGFLPNCRGLASTVAPPSCGISTIVPAQDGSLIVAGSFAGFGPVNRERIAKLHAETGAADPTWNPFAWIAAAPIVDVAVFDGKVVLVLGGASARVATVALDGAGLPIPGSPTIPLPGHSATLAPPNHLYFATGPSNAQRVRRLRLDTGAIDPDWSSREFQSVEAIAWDPASQSVVVAGSEPFAGSLLGRLLIRVGNAAGAPEWAGWNPFQFTVSRFRRLLVAGDAVFADACDSGSINCAIRRLSLAGNGQFDPGYSGSVPFGYQSLAAVDASGRALLIISNNGLPSPSSDGSRLVRLTEPGALDPSFRPRIRTDAGVALLAPSRSGDVVLHGFFTWVGDARGDKFLRLRGDNDQLAEWRPFGPTCESSVCESTTAIAADARNNVFIATSLFNDSFDTSPPSLRRFQPEGEAPESWHPARVIGTYSGEDARIHALVVDDANGWLYIGGRFEGDVCGQPRRNLARVTLAAPCRADPAWQPDPDGTVESLLLDGQGRLVAGGAFRNIAGQPVNNLARFDGAVLDAGWRPLESGIGVLSVPKLAATPGYVFAEVRQSLPGSTPSAGLLRFSIETTPAPTTWSPPPAQQIDVLVAATGGRLLAVRRGVMPQPFGTPVDRIEVFDAAGSGAPSATLALAAGQRISAAALRRDGGVLVGGRFDRIGTVERTTLATLYLDPLVLFASSFE